jgi:hypothetical protein
MARPDGPTTKAITDARAKDPAGTIQDFEKFVTVFASLFNEDYTFPGSLSQRGISQEGRGSGAAFPEPGGEEVRPKVSRLEGHFGRSKAANLALL